MQEAIASGKAGKWLIERKLADTLSNIHNNGIQHTTPPTITDEGPSKGLADRPEQKSTRSRRLARITPRQRNTPTHTMRSDGPTGPNIGRLEDDLYSWTSSLTPIEAYAQINLDDDRSKKRFGPRWGIERSGFKDA